MIKLYIITSINSYSDAVNVVVLTPRAEDHSVCHDIEWSEFSSYEKYGTFDFIIVLTEAEKKNIEQFINNEKGEEIFVKGNNAKSWKEIFKESEYRKNVQFQAIN